MAYRQVEWYSESEGTRRIMLRMQTIALYTILLLGLASSLEVIQL